MDEQEINKGIELPAVSPENRRREYRYACGQATRKNECDGLVKVDTEKEEASEWWDEGIHVQEPRFIPDPGSEEEDGGVVIAEGLDREKETPILTVLDARGMKEIARVELPFRIPFGFHGRFFEDL